MEPTPDPGDKMSPASQQPVWQFIGESVRGSSHVRADKPNQDAIAWLPAPVGPSEERLEATPRVVEGLPIITAIADGHGSDRYVHSDRGSRFAVEVTVALLDKFVASYQGESFRDMRRAAQEKLPAEILKRWKERVEKDIAGAISGGNDANSESAEEGLAPRQNASQEHLIGYGATLLACAVTPTYILYLQLGDGDILAVSPDGSVERPITKDENLIANETYSLCQPEAKKFFRFVFKALDDLSSDQWPTLIMLSTDGYANSFETEADFQSAAKDFWKMAQERGLDVIRERLKGWLNETSVQGSGDDITLAIVNRLSENDPVYEKRQFEAMNKTVFRNNNDITEIKKSMVNLEQKIEVLARRSQPMQWAIGIVAALLLSFSAVAVVGYMQLSDTIKATTLKGRGTGSRENDTVIVQEPPPVPTNESPMATEIKPLNPEVSPLTISIADIGEARQKVESSPSVANQRNAPKVEPHNGTVPSGEGHEEKPSGKLAKTEIVENPEKIKKSATSNTGHRNTQTAIPGN